MSRMYQQILQWFRSRPKGRIKHIGTAFLWILLLVFGFWIQGMVSQPAPQSDPAAPAFSETEVSPTPAQTPKTEVPAVEEETEKKRLERYDGIEISEEEMLDLARIVYLEAGDQSIRGQQAVTEVILNRVIAKNFPNTVHDVLFQGAETSTPQFSTAPYISSAAPTEEQYLAIEQALYGPAILPADVVYFSQGGENEYIWGNIDGHIYCYQYPWNRE